MSEKYKQLNYEQRCQISALKKKGDSQRAIAKLIGVSQSTLNRELGRNTGKRGYRHKQAQNKVVLRRARAVKPTKMTPAMIELIESKLRLDWSPEQISGGLIESKGKLISHETIYLHIWADKKPATIALLTPFKEVVHTITANNGKEFAYHEGISKALAADVYFAHPYNSWEHGLNENTNGLLLQYFPKKTDLKHVSRESVIYAVSKLNNRPRKLLDYRTPAQIMGEHLAAIAA